jgi:uncharacterized protein (TIGR02246 family)
MNLPVADRDALEMVIAGLEEAWNAGDGARFAAHFTSDAEQVNIFGMQLHGREEIERRHDQVFKSVFLNSTNSLSVIDARLLAADVMLARILSGVEVPQGPLQGRVDTIASLVLLRTGARWEIALFHNTRIVSPV